ncbi:dipeptidyl aminopeptidase A [Monosporozyma servazzii]
MSAADTTNTNMPEENPWRVPTEPEPERPSLQSDEEDIERIPESHFNSNKKQLLDRYIKIGIITLMLVWGSVILVKSLGHLKMHIPEGDDGNSNDGDKNHNNDTYTLPDPFMTEDGLLKISFNHTRNKTFVPEFHTLQWLNSDVNGKDKGLYFTSINDTYQIRSVSDEHYSKILFEGKNITYEGHDLTVESIVASPDLNKLLIKTNSIQNWRHSSFATYFVFNEDDSSIQHIGDSIALTEWSPNSIDLAYIQDNNIYLYSTKQGKTIDQITNDGNSQIFNGKPDWVYEEEVFEDDRTLWWSPDGKHLAYLRIDETDVEEYTIPYFVQEEHEQYPEMRNIKYPKSGTPNPKVELLVYDTEDCSVYQGHINKVRSYESLLVTEVKWTGTNRLIAKMTDRSSDVLDVIVIDVGEQKTSLVRSEPSNGSWWEITHNTMHIPKNESKGRIDDGYVDLKPVDGYNHLVYFPTINATDPIILTCGKWEVVLGPIAFDNELERIYFQATKKASNERHIYYVNLNKPRIVHDVTDTSRSGVYGVTFSSNCKFVLLTYQGPNIPYQKIISLYPKNERDDKKDIVGNKIGKTLYYLEKNEVLEERLEAYSIPKKTFKEMNLGKDSDGNDIIVNTIEILPDGFNQTLRDYYPVFFYPYGGPNSQQAIQTFSVGFNEVIASQLNAIVVVVDGRGTGYKGIAFRSLVRGNLGDYEAADQISAASIYAKKDFVNSEKIAIFGWSYGGYLTLKTLERDAGATFKYGLAVAPVTDWRFYDSVYTERYMYTPQENIDGYKRSRVENVTSIAQANRFLLMHGTGDDNVHFQHSLVFLDQLNQAGVENYDVHVFPDSDHSIKYHNASVIVWDKLLSWTRNAFTGRFTADF